MQPGQSITARDNPNSAATAQAGAGRRRLPQAGRCLAGRRPPRARGGATRRQTVARADHGRRPRRTRRCMRSPTWRRKCWSCRRSSSRRCRAWSRRLRSASSWPCRRSRASRRRPIPSCWTACRMRAMSASILRSAGALGFRQVLALKGTAALWSPKVLRAGMGAHFGLNLVEGLSIEDLDALKVPLLATSSHCGCHAPSSRSPQPLRLGHGPRRAGRRRGADAALRVARRHSAAGRRRVLERGERRVDLPLRIGSSQADLSDRPARFARRAIHRAIASAATPNAMNTAPAMRHPRSPSPSNCPPISAANSIDCLGAGATRDSGASFIA